MKLTRLSDKQKIAVSWWMPGSPYCHREAILCDGAVRSGKTLAMGVGFFLWAGSCFKEQQFGLCGKTVGALRRNVLSEVLPVLRGLGFSWSERRSENLLTVRFRGRENHFYLFGGLDERSADLIQGITFAGVLLDEAALMPRSFVEQACARCSVAGSRLWFNCNPAGPGHWLYKAWVLEAERRNCLRLHFTMEDNPGLTPEIRARYEKLYTGVFYKRFVLGQWVQAEGRVYDFFTPDMAGAAPESCDLWYISCDYGTVNPTSMGLWGRHGGKWYRVKEFYFDSRKERRQMTDGEYAQALGKLAGARDIREVIVDPSAASFIEVLRREGWRVRKAQNDVLAGIRLTADALKSGKIVICQNCENCLREMEAYIWDPACRGQDRVRKEFDHAMDDMRYFVSTVLGGSGGGFGVWTAARQGGYETKEFGRVL